MPFFLALLALGAQNASAAVQAQSDLSGLSASQDWKWLSNPAKFPEYYAVVILTLPQDANTERVTFANGSRVMSRGPGTLKVMVPGATETIQGVVAGGSSHTVRLTVQPDAGRAVAEWNCKNLDLELVPAGPVPPQAYAGMACIKGQNNDVQLWISVPREVEWGNTTLFEDAGKGERWHQFTLPKYERGVVEKEVGSFSFMLNGAPFTYKLVQRKNARMVGEQNATTVKAQKLEKENKKLQNQIKYLAAQQTKPEEPVITFKGGVGAVQLGMTVPTASPSSIQPVVIFGARTKPLLLGINAGAQVKYAIAYSESSQAFYDIFVNVGPTFKVGDSSSIEPVVGFLTMGQDFDPEGVSFRHTAAGLGLNLNLSSIWIELVTSGMIPGGESKYMSLGLGYRPSPKERVSLSYGAYYQKTSYDQVTSDYGQIMGALFVHF